MIIMAKNRASQKFVLFLIAGMCATILVYAVLHLAYHPGKQPTDSSKLAKVTDNGELVIMDKSGFDWFIGIERVKLTIDEMNKRYLEIKELRRTIQDSLKTFAAKLNQDFQKITSVSASISKQPSQIETDILAALNNGKYEETLALVTKWENDLASTTRDRVGDVSNIRGELSKLVNLKDSQVKEFGDSLSVPVSLSFFWTTPSLSIIEVLFFALFGVLTNLLVNSAEYLRLGKFNPAERWVAYTKLVYGPILAVVLVLAIINGWFDLGDYEVRVWTLPLVGFFFGYFSRKTVLLFDRLGQRIFGQAEKSVDAGPSEIAQKRQRIIDLLKDATKPETLVAFANEAKILVRRPGSFDLNIGNT